MSDWTFVLTDRSYKIHPSAQSLSVCIFRLTAHVLLTSLTLVEERTKLHSPYSKWHQQPSPSSTLREPSSTWTTTSRHTCLLSRRSGAQWVLLPVSTSSMTCTYKTVSDSITGKVIKFNDDAPYCVQATLEFKDIQSFQAAASGEEAKGMFDGDTNGENTS